MKVVREWVEQLPLRMQSTLMLALRGPDDTMKETDVKYFVREYRYVILTPAFPKEIYPDKPDDTFMGAQKGYLTHEDIIQFKNNHDHLPHHWLMHFIHASEIVGQFHPDDQTRAFWWSFYLEMCDSMHMFPEQIDQLSRRLVDPPWVIDKVSPLLLQLSDELNEVKSEAWGWAQKLDEPTGRPRILTVGEAASIASCLRALYWYGREVYQHEGTKFQGKP